MRSWSPTSITALALVAATLATPEPASANRLTLVDADPVWRDAVMVALEPWGSVVHAATASSPADELTPSERGERLAGQSGDPVVVWFELREPGSTLWIYDRTTRAAVGQELPRAPPFDAATAAAVALSLKTALRHSAVDPETQPPEPSSPPEPSAPVEPTEALPAPWTLELLVGPRLFATEPDDVDPRMSVFATHWLDALERHVGLGLRVSGGLGVEVDGALLHGRWVEASVELALHARFTPTGPLELGAWVGAGVGVSSLHGMLRSGQRPVEDWRAGLTMSGGVDLGIRATRSLRLGLRVGADGLPWRHRYLVRGVPVLTPRGVALSAQLGVEISVGG